MREKNKKEKVENKLSVVRRASYTILAFAVFELGGVFALAGLRGLYVVTETKSNAFYPKSYVDVGLEEPNGQDYHIGTDNIVVNTDGNGKQVYVENKGSTSKKSVILRAKIVAEIYEEATSIYQGTLTTLDYDISVNGDNSYDDKSNGWYYNDGYYYYTSILNVNENSTDLFDEVRITDEGLQRISNGCCVKFHVIIDCLDAEVSKNGTLSDYWSNVPKGLVWNSAT